MDNIYQFVLTFYKIFVWKNSTLLKKFYFNTFESQMFLDDAECDADDNSCLFDELFDELTDKIRSKVQNIWWILYCDIEWGFLITYDNEHYLINGEVLEDNINEAACYFYDLFGNVDGN